MTPERDTSRVNCRRSSPPSTSSSPASAFALWYLGLAAGAHGEVGVGTETERERATVGGHPRGKEAIVVLRPAWRRGDGDGDEKKARAAAAAVGMVVALAGDGRGQGGGLCLWGFGRIEKAETRILLEAGLQSYFVRPSKIKRASPRLNFSRASYVRN